MSILEEIVSHKKEELRLKKRERSEQSLRSELTDMTSPFAFTQALNGDKPYHLICEVKPASPSAGTIQDKETFQPERIVDAYNEVASGLSVLADKRYFQGSVELVQQVRQMTPHPVLFKEFVVDAYQIAQARWASADAVLLIMKSLEASLAKDLYQQLIEEQLTPVLEIQNKAELNQAIVLLEENQESACVLINNRNLDTFSIEFDTTHQLAPLLPTEVPVISASGIHSKADIDALLPSAHRFLIGTSLMKEGLDNLPNALKALQPKAVVS